MLTLYSIVLCPVGDEVLKRKGQVLLVIYTVFCLGPKTKHLVTAVDIAEYQPRVK